MCLFSKNDMKKIITFFISNISRFLKNDSFEFCLTFIKSPNKEHKKMIAGILRNTDCVFEFEDGIVILFSGASKKFTQNISNEINTFLNSKSCECIAYYPYDGNNYDDLINRLNKLTYKNYKVKLIYE
ncbi:hypothetical protein [Campylobacter sp. MG1]|uniref:hypothetical protein n=1 Tax=Campylobacter sp. MG1 TaxID=2976332 RepID=UPI00226C7DA5|nr:hypothetical protein [Campylobacter sp. MG1]